MRLNDEILSLFCVVVAACFATIASAQDLTLYKNKNGDTARGTVSLEFAYFSLDSSWYGKSRSNIGKKCGIWREAAITPGLEANFGLGNTSTFYGRVSAVGAYTWGVDAAGSNVGSGDVYDWRMEDSYIGWRSGNIISSLDKDALDISIGRQKYQVGTGFLFWRASSNGGDRGAAWTVKIQIV